MVFEGNQKLDPAFKRAVIDLYWAVSDVIGANADLTPDERLIMTAVEIGLSNPHRHSPFNVSQIASLLNAHSSTIRDRVNRLQARGYLIKVGRQVVTAPDQSLEPFYPIIARYLVQLVSPLIEQIRDARPAAFTANDPPSPVGKNRINSEGQIIDDPLRFRIARLFFDVSMEMESMSGLDATDRLIVLTVVSARAKGTGTGIRSIAEATRISKRSTVADRVKTLLARGTLVEKEDGLDATPAHVGQIYEAIIELFIVRAEPVIRMILARREQS